MTIEWRTDLETGNKLIDSQHKELFKRTASLVDACNKGLGRLEVKGLIEYLEQYIQQHFTAEEKLQLDFGYPDYNKHKKQHDDFIFEFGKLKDRLEQIGATTDFVIHINRTLVEWLVFHISRSDKEIALFIKEN